MVSKRKEDYEVEQREENGGFGVMPSTKQKRHRFSSLLAFLFPPALFCCCVFLNHLLLAPPHLTLLAKFARVSRVISTHDEHMRTNLFASRSSSPCRKRSPAKGVWQKSDEKSDRSIREGDQKVTERVPKTKINDRTPFADIPFAAP